MKSHIKSYGKSQGKFYNDGGGGVGGAGGVGNDDDYLQ
jgi:hypothetical protein